jgi:hypothetical protein
MISNPHFIRPESTEKAKDDPFFYTDPIISIDKGSITPGRSQASHSTMKSIEDQISQAI